MSINLQSAAQCSFTTKVEYEGVKKYMSNQYRESNTHESYRNYDN